ncbi:MAG: dTDP-4-dehydrorhamnose 3,5-epimerase [Nitrososphaera sp.]|nr:dTDP-4-dehydrorhamnose 3,5-epimerase [Nitrososphaera sp.]MCI0590561.1 dTDP-4-dehydrorhamnose 3,5-epimerase [Gammaproteobacteria bacterium]
MKVIETTVADVLIIEPKLFIDERGFFMEIWNANTFAQATGIALPFVQDNHSRSSKGVLRGLHYQIRHPQGKLVRVVIGEVFDIAVDLRRSSPTFGKWAGVILSAENKRSFWVPPGIVHGFLVLSDSADLLYKTTDYYAPEWDRCIAWNDPTLAIKWPLNDAGIEVPTLSPKDAAGTLFAEAETFE